MANAKERDAKRQGDGKREAAAGAGETARGEAAPGEAALRRSPMMAHLLEALREGRDIGHYGRLTFTMIARHYLDPDALQGLLKGQPGFDPDQARALVRQVEAHGYNPPTRERILEWQERQEFPICPEPDDPRGCNVYRELELPETVFEQIEEYWEEKAA